MRSISPHTAANGHAGTSASPPVLGDRLDHVVANTRELAPANARALGSFPPSPDLDLYLDFFLDDLEDPEPFARVRLEYQCSNGR